MITAIECTELQSRALFLIEVYGPLGWSIFDRDLSDDDRRAIRVRLAFLQMVRGIEKFREAIAVGMLPAIRACALAFGEFSRQAAKMNQGREGR